MLQICAVAIFFLLEAGLYLDIRAYEGAALPEQDGWARLGTMDAERWVVDGWFYELVDLGVWKPAPGGEQDAYEHDLNEFIGRTRFFIEWRMQTDGDRSEIPGVAPGALVAGGTTGVKYHFTIARDRVRLIRDNFLPIVFIDINPDHPHTYRLELYGDELYVWYIDGEVMDQGRPEGAYPTHPSNNIKWGAFSWFLENMVWWDYIRFGAIPEDGSGDYDTDAEVTLNDFYFFQECLSNRRPGINGGPGQDAGPGCHFADFDFDDDVDLLDFAEFQWNLSPRH